MMAKIFYSMAGEGRGHATRVRAVVEELRPRHEIVLFAPGDAHDLLEPVYRDTEVEVRRIPCMRFAYSQKRLNPFATAWSGAGYVARLPWLVDELRRQIEREAPDLVISDFEPALPRAAKRAGVPFISFDHQHFLSCCDLSMLPWSLRLRTSIWGLVVSGYFSGQAATIVSGFFKAPLKPKWGGRATQVGVLLRPEILSADRASRGHLLVYLRKFGSGALLAALEEVGIPTIVYGLGERPTEGKLQFRAIDEHRFLDDLAGCEAIVCTAGNQVVGEALYLGKPVLAMPEKENHEQYVNAHFLRQSGAGDWVELDRIDAAGIRAFLAKLDEWRSRIDVQWLNGNPAAIATLERFLQTSARTERSAGRAPATAALAAR